MSSIGSVELGVMLGFLGGPDGTWCLLNKLACAARIGAIFVLRGVQASKGLDYEDTSGREWHIYAIVRRGRRLRAEQVKRTHQWARRQCSLLFPIATERLDAQKADVRPRGHGRQRSEAALPNVLTVVRGRVCTVQSLVSKKPTRW